MSSQSHNMAGVGIPKSKVGEIDLTGKSQL